MKIFLELFQISISSSDVIPLAMFATRPHRKPIYLFFLSLRVIPSESDALHFPVTRYEILRQITICNNDCKFAAYSHNILHEFTVYDEVMITIHFEGSLQQL